MKPLLQFLAEHCEFLFAPGYYRIVDSGSSHSMSNAHVDLRWREIVLQLTLDRSAIDLGIHLPEFEHPWADESGRDALIRDCQELKTQRSRTWSG